MSFLTVQRQIDFQSNIDTGKVKQTDFLYKVCFLISGPINYFFVAECFLKFP